MKYVRPIIQDLKAYIPGEQPKIAGLVKLNTNENPYPPAPAVLEAVRSAVDARLRLYPNPTADRLREKLADLHKCQPENIIVGNGSDEILALAVRAFVEPKSACTEQTQNKCLVQFFDPSYSLYPVLAAIHGALPNPVPLRSDFSLPDIDELMNSSNWRFDAALTLITTPNAPSGKGYSTRDLEMLCKAQNGVVLLDEAYVDFAEENAMALALKLENTLVARTFSKAYSLCFQRIGYCVGPAYLIEALMKIKDSYNVNGLGQIAAFATLENIEYYKNNFCKIITTRTTLTNELRLLGFEVYPSSTNFILTKPPKTHAENWLKLLRENNILVRWFPYPRVKDYLRITIGSDDEINKLISAIRKILNNL